MQVGSKSHLCLQKIFAIVLIVSSCGMSEHTHSSGRARIQITPRGVQNIPKPELSLTSTNQPPPFAPSDIGSFDCLFINVMGPGIGEWDENEKGLSINPGSSYLSVYSHVLDTRTGGTAEISV